MASSSNDLLQAINNASLLIRSMREEHREWIEEIRPWRHSNPSPLISPPSPPPQPPPPVPLESSSSPLISPPPPMPPPPPYPPPLFYLHPQIDSYPSYHHDHRSILTIAAAQTIHCIGIEPPSPPPPITRPINFCPTPNKAAIVQTQVQPLQTPLAPPKNQPMQQILPQQQGGHVPLAHVPVAPPVFAAQPHQQQPVLVATERPHLRLDVPKPNAPADQQISTTFVALNGPHGVVQQPRYQAVLPGFRLPHQDLFTAPPPQPPPPPFVLPLAPSEKPPSLFEESSKKPYFDDFILKSGHEALREKELDEMFPVIDLYAHPTSTNAQTFSNWQDILSAHKVFEEMSGIVFSTDASLIPSDTMLKGCSSKIFDPGIF